MAPKISLVPLQFYGLVTLLHGRLIPQGLTAKPRGFHSLRLGEEIPGNAAFENCWFVGIVLKQELSFIVLDLANRFIVATSVVIEGRR